MGKHSNFPRRKHDEYPTPAKAVRPLWRFLDDVRTFAEPCCGDGRLIRHIEGYGPLCIHSGDIQTGTDALTCPVLEQLVVDAIITNPPYTWELLEPMIWRFSKIAPTWLLLEADFKHNERCAKLMRICSDVVSIGRVRWFDDTEHEGKVNYAWYRFDARHRGDIKFHPREKLPPMPRARPAAAA
ncbi:hypothetical protein [Ciceribacter sp. L1K22]|uniref:hypothetical protein n=1 Tax=Ciceribacter sp. L1K22 TaxID=2820275 RepID=UPI001ABE0B32|nr:hypothetical protein [Ciceribacter sp. L1K22]MBO3760384.1 hypothetical protein [Ciceribacter sp. L1K22]